MSNFVSGWYLIYTRPHREKKVVECLAEREVIHYLPTIMSVRNWNDRKKLLELPLFPSYVFVYLQQLSDYYAGLNADGALNYVRFGKQIARVSESVINNLKIVIGQGANLEISSTYFAPSHKLLIKEGPFSGLSCEVVQYKNKEKILVRVSLLNRYVLVDIPSNHLMPQCVTSCY